MDVYPPVVKRGWRGNPQIKQRFEEENHLYTWCIFHCCVWLPEGIKSPLHYLITYIYIYYIILLTDLGYRFHFIKCIRNSHVVVISIFRRVGVDAVTKTVPSSSVPLNRSWGYSCSKDGLWIGRRWSDGLKVPRKSHKPSVAQAIVCAPKPSLW